jgi:hypothetical protein
VLSRELVSMKQKDTDQCIPISRLPMLAVPIEAAALLRGSCAA